MSLVHTSIENLCQLAPDWFRLQGQRGVFPPVFEIRNVGEVSRQHRWHVVAFADGSSYPDADTQCARLTATLLAMCDSRGWFTNIVFDPQLEPDLRAQATISSSSGFQHRCASSRVEALISCTVGTLTAFASRQLPLLAIKEENR